MQDGHYYLWMIGLWVGGLLVIALIDTIKEWQRGSLKKEAFFRDLPKNLVPDERMTAMR